MTQIEPKSANAVAKLDPDGGSIVRRKQPWLERATFHQLTTVDPLDILERWSSGEPLNKIAESFSVTPSALTRWLQRQASQEDRELARELHYQTRLDTWLDQLEADGDDVNLARAREVVLRRLEYRAGIECKRFQQQKPQTAVQINGSDGMQVQIVSFASNNAAQQSGDDAESLSSDT